MNTAFGVLFALVGVASLVMSVMAFMGKGKITGTKTYNNLTDKDKEKIDKKPLYKFTGVVYLYILVFAIYEFVDFYVLNSNGGNVIDIIRYAYIGIGIVAYVIASQNIDKNISKELKGE